MSVERRLAVLGDPVEHSRSPALHAAAYAVLGLPWTYGRERVASGGLAAFLDGLDASWRGLSLTMPHKQVVLPLLDEKEPLVGLTGAANTVLLEGGRRLGFNTDVHGIVAALREVGAGMVKGAVVLGSGATAASAVAALGQLGAQRITVLARDAAKAAALAPLAEAVGATLAVGGLDDSVRLDEDQDAVVSTLPPGAADPLRFPLWLRRNAALLDVAYGGGETRLAAHWAEAGGVTAPGLLMLLHQAVEQVRIFVTGGRGPLTQELAVRAAMRAAVGL